MWFSPMMYVACGGTLTCRVIAGAEQYLTIAFAFLELILSEHSMQTFVNPCTAWTVPVFCLFNVSLSCRG